MRLFYQIKEIFHQHLEIVESKQEKTIEETLEMIRIETKIILIIILVVA